MAGQGYSYTSHIADGVVTTYPFSLVGLQPGYFNRDHIFAYQRTKAVDPEQGGTDTWVVIPPNAYEFTSDTTLQFYTAPFANSDGKDDLMIRRQMPRGAPYAGYDIGTRFTKDTLNRSFLQQLYCLHEALDNIGEDMSSGSGINIFEDLNMQSYRVTNLGQAVDFFDAVNKGITDELSTRISGIEAAQGTLARGPLIISLEPPSGIPDELAEWVQIGDVGASIPGGQPPEEP
jgi:hypothetical protein